MPDNYLLYESMLLIRRFEERILAEFSAGKLVGTTHTYVGQEANAVGIFAAVGTEEVVFSNHRCHGHFLAYGGDPYALFAELMGKATGLVGGRGGSQHIQWKNFYSNGVQGGIVPVAAGMALAEKVKKTGTVVLVFLGDGTLGEGVVYETFNISALWNLPVLFVVENNRYAQTTAVSLAVAGSFAERFRAFGIDVWERETSDVLEVRSVVNEAVKHVRSGRPAGLILHTYRFSAHSKGDDTRIPEEIARIQQFDPLSIHESRLTPGQKQKAEKIVASRLEEAFLKADADPAPDPAGLESMLG